MKLLTDKELFEAPGIVQFIYLNASVNLPIGSSTLEKAIKEHPEYFPDEIERRDKWNAIPQEVHDAYFKAIIYYFTLK